MNEVAGRRVSELPDLITIRELSVLLQIPVSTLYEWRTKGVGPTSVKIGKHLRYPRFAVEAWLDTLLGTSDG